MGNDAFLPYGSSVLESARRIWRQLILVEDAMLVYRVVRSPERRVFKIDVGNVPPEDIPNYMEQAQASLKKSSIVDRSTGRVDLRYNPLSIDEDYFIPVRGGESGTKIDPIEGQQISGETTDVEYIQKKLFAALKVPKAYLGYEEGLGSKATLSQQDIRFARSIARVQRTVLAELNKLAIIHLYCNGFSGEDLLDFTLNLSTPSTISQLQKLELIKTRFETATVVSGLPGGVDRRWIQKNVLRLTDEEISNIQRGLKEDKLQDLTIESVQLDSPEPEADPGAEGAGAEPMGDFGGFGDETEPAGEAPPAAEAEPIAELNIDDEDAPIKVDNVVKKITALLSEDENIQKSLIEDEDEEDTNDKKRKEAHHKVKEKNRKAQVKEKRGLSGATNYAAYTTKDKDPYGMKKELSDIKKSWKSPDINEEHYREDFNLDEYLDNKIQQNAFMTGRIKSALNSLDDHINSKPRVISESDNSSGEKDD